MVTFSYLNEIFYTMVYLQYVSMVIRWPKILTPIVKEGEYYSSRLDWCLSLRYILNIAYFNNHSGFASFIIYWIYLFIFVVVPILCKHFHCSLVTLLNCLIWGTASGQLMFKHVDLRGLKFEQLNSFFTYDFCGKRCTSNSFCIDNCMMPMLNCLFESKFIIWYLRIHYELFRMGRILVLSLTTN